MTKSFLRSKRNAVKAQAKKSSRKQRHHLEKLFRAIDKAGAPENPPASAKHMRARIDRELARQRVSPSCPCACDICARGAGAVHCGNQPCSIAMLRDPEAGAA
jgi:hypothetical protein